MNNHKDSILPEKLLNPLEVAEILGISKSKVYQLLNEGFIPVVRMGGSLRIDPRDLAQYINVCKSSFETRWGKESVYNDS